MDGVLLKYNKVHNDSLRNLEPNLAKHFKVLWGDLSIFGKKIDLLAYDIIEDYFSTFGTLSFIVVGDIFWKTGQSICRYGYEHDIPVFFLQHGQWIYVKNKKKLNYYPAYTLLFGDNVVKMCSSWTYGKHSYIAATGNPRYDGASPNGGSYIYFSPPVIEELIHGRPTGRIRRTFYENLEAIKHIDKKVQLVVHPHYREARTDYLHKLFPYAQFADPRLDALKLIRGANKVLVSRNSTVVLDAIAYQKPVVLMDLPAYDNCFFKRGYFDEFALESNTKFHLMDNLLIDIKNTCVDHNKAKKHIYLGNASDRITEWIKKGIIKS